MRISTFFFLIFDFPSPPRTRASGHSILSYQFATLFWASLGRVLHLQALIVQRYLPTGRDAYAFYWLCKGGLMNTHSFKFSWNAHSFKISWNSHSFKVSWNTHSFKVSWNTHSFNISWNTHCSDILLFKSLIRTLM